jgi:hypothetical protein
MRKLSLVGCFLLATQLGFAQSQTATMSPDEALVRETYAKLSYAIELGAIHDELDKPHANINGDQLAKAVAPKQMTFVINSLKTGKVADIANRNYADFVTPPGGWLLDIATGKYFFSEEGKPGYISDWNAHASWHQERDASQGWDRYTVKQVVRPCRPARNGTCGGRCATRSRRTSRPLPGVPHGAAGRSLLPLLLVAYFASQVARAPGSLQMQNAKAVPVQVTMTLNQKGGGVTGDAAVVISGKPEIHRPIAAGVVDQDGKVSIEADRSGFSNVHLTFGGNVAAGQLPGDIALKMDTLLGVAVNKEAITFKQNS